MRQAIAGVLVAVCLGSSAAHAGGPVPGTAAPVVSYDPERCCVLISGQPFFAIGCYDVVPEYQSECAAAGFNLAARTNSDSELSRALKEAAVGPASSCPPTARPSAGGGSTRWAACCPPRSRARA
jgi:hypothetical protein